MLQVVDLFLEATQKKVNSLVRRTKSLYTATVNEEMFQTDIMFTTIPGKHSIATKCS